MFINRPVLFCGLWAAWLSIALPARAQSPTRPPATVGLLRELNASVEELTARVSMSVVQVLVTGYGPVDERTSPERA